MQKRELVNLFIDDGVYNLMDKVFSERKSDKVTMNFNNCFDTKILLIHDSCAQGTQSISKVALVFVSDDVIHGKAYNHKTNFCYQFIARLMGDQLSLTVSHGLTPSQEEKIKLFAQNYLVILSMINYGWLAASDDLNRKDRRRIYKNNAKQPEYSIEGETYKIIDISKRYNGKYPKGESGDDYTRQREHTRRGHYRHYKKTGKIVWIDAYKAGDASLGVIVKDYKV